MLLYGDYHTHTIYSRFHHGKGTVLENASVAAEKGLKEIAESTKNREGVTIEHAQALQQQIEHEAEIFNLKVEERKKQMEEERKKQAELEQEFAKVDDAINSLNLGDYNNGEQE